MAETTFTSRNRAQCERPQRRVSSQTEELTEMFSLLTFFPDQDGRKHGRTLGWTGGKNLGQPENRPRVPEHDRLCMTNRKDDV